MACHHLPWKAYTVRQRRTSHIIIARGLHIQLDEVGRGNYIIDLGHYTRSNDIGLHIPLSPLESTRSNDTDVKCHHPLWTTQIVRRCKVWHAHMALGQHTRSDDIRRGMLSSPLGNICNQTTSGVACHHLSYVAHSVGQCRAWHPIIIYESTHDQQMSA